jgi:hypothetical protein
VPRIQHRIRDLAIPANALEKNEDDGSHQSQENELNRDGRRRITAAETAKFDVFLTVDQGIEYQKI